MAEIFETFGGRVPYFLTFLGTPVGSIPKGAQWIVVFEELEKRILPGIKRALTYEGQDWQIEKAAEAVLSDNFQKISGCMFCQAIGLPKDGMTTQQEGNIQSNAFLRSHVGQVRTLDQTIRVTFLDTNVSFAENFLRPWAISTANFGLIARDPDSVENYRTNAHFYKLGSYSSNLPPTITMKVSFYGLCCIDVAGEEYTYSAASGPVLRESSFIYNHYAIDTTSDNLCLTTSPIINSSGVQTVSQLPASPTQAYGAGFSGPVPKS
jgi:hypothetical protein